MRKRNKIGGDFDLDLAAALSYRKGRLERLPGAGYASLDFFRSGRAACLQALKTIDFRKNHLLLPDYLCGEALEAPITDHGFKVRHYPVPPSLNISLVDLLPYIRNDTRAILLINYFGIRRHPALAAELRKRFPGLIILVDAVQDPYYLFDSRRFSEHFTFTSFRKFLPVGDGGALRGLKSRPGKPDEWLNPAAIEFLMASIQKNGLITAGIADDRLEQAYIRRFMNQRKHIAMSDINSRMSGFSRFLMDCFDYHGIKKTRRNNFIYLQRRFRLARIPVSAIQQGELKAGLVPHCFPIRVQPDLLKPFRNCMARQEIYLPFFWPDRSSNGLIGLPIDQRYSTRDMRRMFNAILAFFNKKTGQP